MRKIRIKKSDDALIKHLLHNTIHEIGDAGENGWEGKYYLRCSEAFDNYCRGSPKPKPKDKSK